MQLAPDRFWQLLGRKLAGEATLDELRELELLMMSDPEIAAAAEAHETFFHRNTDVKADDLAMENAWKKQLAHIRNENTSIKVRSKVFHRIITLAVVLLTVFFGWWHWQRDKDRGEQNAVSAQRVETKEHSRTRHVLPDGSVVWLNEGSTMSFDAAYGKTNRNIELVGEGYFNVVHNAELPMIVNAGAVNVKVKGTAFNIKAYSEDNNIEASLIRGSIELNVKIKNRKKSVLLKPNEKAVIKIRNKENVKIPLADALQIDTLAVEAGSGLIPEVAWVEDQLVFVNEPLQQLAEKMQRWYRVEIIIRDSSLLKERFTGAFKEENLEDALNALAFIYGLSYNIEKEKVFIQKNKDHDNIIK